MLTIASTPDAAYEICKKYAPDCDVAIGGEVTGHNRDEEDEGGEEGEEDDDEAEEEEEEDNYDTLYNVNTTADPLSVTHVYQHNTSYVSITVPEAHIG